MRRFLIAATLLAALVASAQAFPPSGSGSGGGPSGSGIPGRVAYWSAASALSSAAGLYWDVADNRLGINVANPQYALDVSGLISTNSGVQALDSSSISAFLIQLLNTSDDPVGSITTATGNQFRLYSKVTDSGARSAFVFDTDPITSGRNFAVFENNGVATWTIGLTGLTFPDSTTQSTAGVTALAAVGSSPSANGASVSSGTLTLQPADGTHPGVLTTGAQTIAGAKTFSSTIGGSVSGNAAGLSSTLAIGSGGTGQTTAQGAIDALLPAQGSANGKYLTSNGSASSWGTVATGSASGYGAYSSRPAAGTAGNFYTCNDCPNAMWVDTGSAWAPIIGGQTVGTQPKAASSFTVFNRSSGTVPTLTDRNGALHLVLGPDANASSKAAGFLESLSSATMYVAASFVHNYDGPVGVPTSQANDNAGIIMRESGTGKFFIADISLNSTTTSLSTGTIGCAYWASPTSSTSNVDYAVPPAVMGGRIFLRLILSGANVLCQTSTDNVNWVTLRTVAKTTAWTSGPDQVGIMQAMGQGGNTSMSDDFLSYISGS